MCSEGTNRDGAEMQTRGLANFGIRAPAYSMVPATALIAATEAATESGGKVLQRFGSRNRRSPGEHRQGVLRLSHVGKSGLHDMIKQSLWVQCVRRTPRVACPNPLGSAQRYYP